MGSTQGFSEVRDSDPRHTFSLSMALYTTNAKQPVLATPAKDLEEFGRGNLPRRKRTIHAHPERLLAPRMEYHGPPATQKTNQTRLFTSDTKIKQAMWTGERNTHPFSAARTVRRCCGVRVLGPGLKYLAAEMPHDISSIMYPLEANRSVRGQASQKSTVASSRCAREEAGLSLAS